MITFDADRAGTGTLEWAEWNENISRGCPNGCLYCFAAYNATARFKLRAPGDWTREEFTKKASITTYRRRSGVGMFPSAHDVTPFNVEAFLRVAKLMLAAGNELLIVSKPRLDCITRLVAELEPYKRQIMFRFTIGTLDGDVTAFWEPGAPTPSERIDALKFVHAAHYRTSVSAEPLLGGAQTAVDLVNAVRPWLTDTVWIGLMNKIRQRVDMTVPANVAAVDWIERMQRDDAVKTLVERLQDDPVVRWKDSIEKVIGRLAQGRGAAASSDRFSAII